MNAPSPLPSILVATCLALALGSLGCRSVYYAAWEKVGVHKRDLLKRRVVAARDEQKAAGEQFEDALTRLKKLYAFDGGNLERTYTGLQKDYDQAAARAERVRARIQDLETVARDLFAEWDQEIGQISTPALQQRSRQRLDETRTRYAALRQSLVQAEQSMGPVLAQFNDQVLFLKHNLNAQAIASLKGEALNIQGDIGKLLDEMRRSIAQADAFVRTLE